MKILVTGIDGFLGKKLGKILNEKHEIFGTSRKGFRKNVKMIDVTDVKKMSDYIRKTRTDVLVHNAAIVDVDFCEKEKGTAFEVNAKATGNLAEICKNNGTRMIYISSDYVFSGPDGGHSVNSKRAPLNNYGLTKKIGEDLIAGHLKNYAILRPTILYGFNDFLDDSNIVINLINRINRNEKIVLDNKRIKYPLLIDDVAHAVDKLISSDEIGTFHISGPTPVTRYNWGKAVAKAFNLPGRNIFGEDLKEINKAQNIKLLGNSFKTNNLERGLKLMRRQMENYIHGNN